jgi:putative cardiolipin synthase
VADSFDAYWSSTAAIPISAFHPTPASPEDLERARAALDMAVGQHAQPFYDAMAATPLGLQLRAHAIEFYWAPITALYDPPEKAGDAGESDLLLEQLGDLLGRAQAELLIVSPYFVPGKPGTAALVAAAQRGTRVRVVTNSLASTDVGAVHAGYKKWRRKLLEGGVELYEMMPSPNIDAAQTDKFSFKGSSAASLHAKLFILDRQRVFIGSMNLDPRSVELNTEIGLLIDSAALAGDLQQQVGGLLEAGCYRVELLPVDRKQPNGKQQLVWTESRGGEQIRHTEEPHTTFWQRFSVGFIGLFPIDSQL